MDFPILVRRCIYIESAPRAYNSPSTHSHPACCQAIEDDDGDMTKIIDWHVYVLFGHIENFCIDSQSEWPAYLIVSTVDILPVQKHKNN